MDTSNTSPGKSEAKYSKGWALGSEDVANSTCFSMRGLQDHACRFT